MSEYKWIVTTEQLTHNAEEVQKHRSMGLDGSPPKEAKHYQFHIREVESITEYEDEEYGDITIVKKYNGSQVPVLMNFFELAQLHKEYNEYYDELLENKNVRLEN